MSREELYENVLVRLELELSRLRREMRESESADVHFISYDLTPLILSIREALE